MDKSGIEKTLQTYFDASFELNPEKMDLVFRPEAHIYFMSKGETKPVDNTKNEFIEIVRSMSKLEIPAWERIDEIHFIEFTSAVTAVAKISLVVNDMYFSDVLSFVHDAEKWQIISKLSYGEPFIK